jgi:hypothetical protein
MVPHITTILPRFTGEWALLRQPKAILGVCRESGIPPGAIACSRRSPPCSSSCGRFCMVTPPAVISPICRAYGSRRRRTLKPVPDSRCASLTSSWSASAAPCSEPPWTKGDGRAQDLSQIFFAGDLRYDLPSHPW